MNWKGTFFYSVELEKIVNEKSVPLAFVLNMFCPFFSKW